VTDNESSETVVEIGEDEIEAIAEQVAEITANQQTDSEKDDLAESIVANSAEYDETEAVKEDFPTVEALKTKKNTLSVGAGVPGKGVSANLESEGIDVDAGILGGD